MDFEERIKKTNKLLASYPMEELQTLAVEHNKQARKDFDELKKALSKEECSFCSHSVTYFDEENPCLHWLLWAAPGLKKKHFPQLFEQKGFHNISTYLRWVANCDRSFVNINDLTEESKPTNIIDLTIRYKNLEWSFICSENDRVGHPGAKVGNKPHYHFQMKKDGLVVIKYGYHFPFTDYDEFCFAMREGKFDKLRPGDGRAAGIQTILDNAEPAEVIDIMTHSKLEEDALFKTDIFIEAEEGHTISGDDIADMLKERDKTGVPLARLIDKLKNVKLKKIVSPGPAIPIKSERSSRGKKKKEI